ncbi:MAG: UvrD-helicase domain-containing protein [Parachlamydiaceae bacterium]|nr:UvrD-helicase domain-containing protein [Parachlamydiaceae bacterium]
MMNKQQKLAVETVEGRVLILAGAGSGKTRVLTHRIAHLIGKLGVSPQAVLGLTFTNKAAIEMRHRMGALIDDKLGKEVTLVTFHSFCLQVLRCHIELLGYTSRFTLYNEHDVKRLMNYITRDILSLDGDLPSFAKAEALIQKAKCQGLSPEKLEDPTSVWHERYARNLYSRLEEAMRAYNAVDFDHLLTLTVSLFENHPDLLEMYQERFRYIMVDEYQDTNPVQFRLISLLSAKYNNLCVVGDDDQSIYGWRGASMRNILDFDHAITIKLEQNYRSTTTILQVANAIICCNTERHKKELWSECGVGNPVEVFVALTELQEAEAVVIRLVNLHNKEGLKWSDIAILYRSNLLSRSFELTLMKHSWHDGVQWRIGIPYKVHGSTELYERREVKDLHSYLRFIVNPLDQEALLRIINQPRRGIGEAMLDKLTSYNRANKLPLWSVIQSVCFENTSPASVEISLNEKAIQSLKNFVSLIEELRQKFNHVPLFDAFTWLVERINYKKAIREEVKSEQMREFKWQNIEEFSKLLLEFERGLSERKNDVASESLLADFVTQFPLGEGDSQKFKKEQTEDKVQLMTIHGSKGLEFPACFLVGIEDHIIPHEKSVGIQGIEEERRLMYVAVTRAMKHLTLSMSAKRQRMGKEEIVRPSRFLFDIPQGLLKRTTP